MQKTFPHFLNIVNSIFLSFNFKAAQVVNLTSWSWIEGTSIKQYNIFSFGFIFYVFKHSNDFALKLI